MENKTTDELEKVLNATHINHISDYLRENKNRILDEESAFFQYFKELLKKKKMKQQDVFLAADVPERYGYKLLAGEKRTKQRDIILRLCYAAEFDLPETQRALKLYRMPELYARIFRDALIMTAFNERPGSVIDVNLFLKQNEVEPLRSCGVQE